MKNRNLSILPALTAVAFVMAARGAFVGKVVATAAGTTSISKFGWVVIRETNGVVRGEHDR